MAHVETSLRRNDQAGPFAQEPRARIYARGNIGRDHDHCSYHVAGRTARAQLFDRVEGQGREDPDAELFERTRSALPRYGTISLVRRRAEHAGEAYERPCRGWNGPYLKGGNVPNDPWGKPYVYRSPAERSKYEIMSYGADGQEGGTGTAADITSANND